MSVWLELDFTRGGAFVSVSARGSRGEQTPGHGLGAELDASALARFAAAVRAAAERGRPLSPALIATAQAIERAVLGAGVDQLRARLAEAAGGPLLVRLLLPDADLGAVPWEALCTPGEAMGFWASSPDVLPVRGVTTAEPWHPRAVPRALRVLALAPGGARGLGVLEQALRERVEAGEVAWLDPIVGPAASVKQMFDRLRVEPVPHVLHFVGHGRVGGGGPEIRLADDDDGDETWLPVELFAQQLKASLRGHLRLVVLEACEGALPTALASAAEVLARAGADAVVAHLWPVKADVARACSEQIYRSLATRGDVALAVNEARRAVLGAFGGSAEAFSPVVYLRGPSGAVFDLERGRARLVLFRGTDDERTVPLPPGITTIGRTDDNDIVLHQHGISRHHAELHVAADGIVIVDQRSHNGSYVNGVRVQRARVRAGDTLRFGEVEIAVTAGTDAAPPALTCEVRSVELPDQAIAAPRPPAGPEARLAVLLQVSQTLASPMGIERTLERILDLCLRILPVDRAAVLLAGERGEITPRAVRSRVPVPAGVRLWSRSVVEHVLDHRVAALFADLAADPRIDATRSVMTQGIRASMGTPLAVGERVLGVLYADSVRGDRRLAQEDLDLLAGFGNQAALALDRAAMQERLRSEALLRGRLEGFLAPSAADRFETGAVQLDVVEARVTALCCDLGGAGGRLSALAPRDAMALLGEYLPLVTSAVFGNGGTLVTSTGAEVLAIWGAPLARDDDAERALAAALAAQRATRGRSFALRAGLHTGPAVAGNVGTPRYPRYAALGEAVSVAERACAAAGGGEIVLSAQTATALGGAPPVLDPLSGDDAGGDAIALFRLCPGA